MIRTYFKMRSKQFLRRANQDPGLMLLIAMYIFVIVFYTLPNPWLGVLYYIFPILIYQHYRKDLNFLKSIYHHKAYLLISIEYIGISFIVFLLLQLRIKEPLLHIIGAAFSFIIPFIKKRGQLQLKKIPLSRMPIHIFEWRTALRYNSISVALGYCILIASAYHPFTLGVTIVFITIIIVETYSYQESKEMIAAYFEKYSLITKLKQTSKYIHLVCIPVYLHYSIWNIYQIVYLLFFIFAIQAVLSYSLLKKYGKYKEGEGKRFVNPIEILSICLMILLIFPILYSITKLKEEAINTITKYVEDK